MNSRGAALISVVFFLWPAMLLAQTRDTGSRFEVASVKRNVSECAQGRGGAGPPPGILRVRCISVRDLIQAAYGTFAKGPTPDPRLLQVVSAPDWIENELFDLDAKPSSPASIDQIYGPMLRSLLEDRFGLRIHREVRELPVYILTVDPSGARLPVTPPGTCVRFNPSNPPPQPDDGKASPGLCGRSSIRRNGTLLTIDTVGTTMAQLAGITLSVRAELDRPVIDRTSLEGIFDVHLAFRSGLAAAQDGDPGPSVFAALRDVGLKLSAGKGPVDVLVLDAIHHPSEN